MSVGVVVAAAATAAAPEERKVAVHLERRPKVGGELAAERRGRQGGRLGEEGGEGHGVERRGLVGVLAGDRASSTRSCGDALVEARGEGVRRVVDVSRWRRWRPVARVRPIRGQHRKRSGAPDEEVNGA